MTRPTYLPGLPPDVATDVSMTVESLRSDVAKYDNVRPYNGSQLYTLHMLVARAYAAGQEAGHLEGSELARRMIQADEDARRRAEPKDDGATSG